MNDKAVRIILSVVLVLVLPWVAVKIIGRDNKVQINEEHATPDVLPATSEALVKEERIAVMLADGDTKWLSLEEYILGVIMCEMPADFELEALKAQAVVARTYAMRREASGEKHIGAAVCTSAACCQGYTSPERYGGDAQDVEKLRKAVEGTAGLVLLYNGELIDATYYSCSGGRTEDALAVWGADIPYLQSVSSPGEEGATHYMDTVTCTVDEFQYLLGRTLSGPSETWFGKVTYTEGGGVETMEIGGQLYEGTRLRQILDLRSTAFIINSVGNTVTITTKGYGHRVGMSQYGADAMAKEGSNFTKILEHYYSGAKVSSLFA